MLILGITYPFLLIRTQLGIWCRYHQTILNTLIFTLKILKSQWPTMFSQCRTSSVFTMHNQQCLNNALPTMSEQCLTMFEQWRTNNVSTMHAFSVSLCWEVIAFVLNNAGPTMFQQCMPIQCHCVEKWLLLVDRHRLLVILCEIASSTFLQRINYDRRSHLDRNVPSYTILNTEHY